MPTLMRVSRAAGPFGAADPFLFVAHHDDAYPAGDGKLAPAAPVAGRQIGQDFAGKDGWNLYHGHPIAGFPQHPHRGFETVTIVRRGLVDHADSLGAAARFGEGDVQWLTAGAGIVHSEMFPLLRTDADNPMELFQIWLNLPPDRKMVRPYFSMLWADTIPRWRDVDAGGRAVDVTIVAGGLPGVAAPTPPPDSWASQADANVAIWLVRLDPGATFRPGPAPTTIRTLYTFAGGGLTVNGEVLPDRHVGLTLGENDLTITAGPKGAELLLLQARPIGAPVAQHGPFVMNTADEIQQAFADYRRTRFGGWPWPDDGPTHGHSPDRFARYPDGRVDRPG